MRPSRSARGSQGALLAVALWLITGTPAYGAPDAPPAAAPPPPPVRSLPEWRAERASVKKLLGSTALVEEATARMQNTLAEGGWVGALACQDPRNLPRRIAVLGRAWQLRVGEAEQRLSTLMVQAEGPLIAPLLDTAEQERLDVLARETAMSRKRVEEAASWTRKHLVVCAQALSAGPGMLRADGDERDVALIALGPGVLCPTLQTLQTGPNVVVMASEQGCIDTTEACACSPQPLTPGSVLGP